MDSSGSLSKTQGSSIWKSIAGQKSNFFISFPSWKKFIYYSFTGSSSSESPNHEGRVEVQFKDMSRRKASVVEKKRGKLVAKAIITDTTSSDSE